MKWLLTSLLLILSLETFSKQYYFRHYRNEDGLSNNTITCGIQDSKGFMWFGTKDGLNFFDGVHFRVFSYSEGVPNCIISNNVSSLKEDSKGNIWIGTDKGICYYDPTDGLFKKIENSQFTISGLIRDVQSDSKNNIWLISPQGIYRYSETSNKLDFYPEYNHFLPTSLCITKSDNVWYSSADGKLNKYDSRSNSFKSYPVLNKQELEKSVLLLKIKEANDNNLLIIMDKVGVKKFDPNSGRVITLFEKDANGFPIGVNDIIQIENEYWIGSETGIHIYDINGGFVNNIKNVTNNPYSISNNAVKLLLKDQEGGIWAGTYYGGLNYLPQESTPFTKYYAQETPGTLKGNVVKAICKDKNGNLWIGTEDAGLNKLNTKTGIFEDFTVKNVNYGIASTNIQGLMADDNDLWIATYDNGIFVIDLINEKVKNHFCAQNPKDGLKNNFVFTFLKAKNGVIYIGTTMGLYKYNKIENRLDFIKNLAPFTLIQSLYEDQQGYLWIGTLGSGLFLYDQKNNNVRHFNFDPEDKHSLGSDYITSIFEDSRNQIWLTTAGNGFCRLNREDYSFMRYNSGKGISSRITCGMLEDGQGFLWISSTDGLIKFNPENLEVTMFKKINGLTENHFGYNSTFEDNTGLLYFGTVNGMISFNPINFKATDRQRPIYITSLLTAATSNHPSCLISEPGKSIIESKKVQLLHDQSTFSIDFASPNFTNPALIKYRYKLEGADTDWQYLYSNRRVYYTNVSPGRYRFIVESAADDNNWENNKTYLDIYIKAPLWRSDVAITIYILIFAVAILFFLRIYKNKKQVEIQHRIDKFERLKEKELLNSKINFFTNITHEIRTPLTLIKAPLERILTIGNHTDIVTENLVIMKRNTDRLLKLINQLLEFRKTENERLRLTYKQLEAGYFIETTIKGFISIAREKNIEIKLFKPENQVFFTADEESLTKIISNLLTNAINYTHDIINVTIEMNLSEENLIRFRFDSNGEMIPPEFREKIFEPFFIIETNNISKIHKGTGLGLPLARSLAELHNGKLFVDPQVKDLNSFVFELPIQQDDAETVIKTKEEIDHPDFPSFSNNYNTINFDQTKPFILIVEDEREMCHFIANTLNEKYNVLIAYNGSEAMEIVKSNYINLIVSDVLMPVLNGYELCKSIKSNLDFSHIPIILLTASASLNARIEGLECGADAYLEKPFSIELLLAQINNIFRNKEVANKNFMNSPFTHYKTIAVNKMDEDFMKQLHAIIVKHMAEPELSVEMLAGSMRMSISTLYRKVKAITELNTNEYIRLYRLKKAAEMLASQKYRINEVSYLVGFSSPSYFTTSFQKQFGISPTQFLKQQHNGKLDDID